jgi:sulfonate transport system permease protein
VRVVVTALPDAPARRRWHRVALALVHRDPAGRGGIGHVRPWLSFALLIAVWAVVTAAGLTTPFLMPSPATVLQTGFKLLADGTLAGHLAVSFLRVAAGFGLGVLLAIPLAAAIAAIGPARALLLPPLEFLRHVPPLGLVPLLILWFGIGEASKVAVIVLAAFFPLFLGTLGGLTQCDPKLIEVGRICGFPRWKIMRRIVLPAATPAVIIGLRLALGYSWRALVGAELIASAAGLGFMIVDAENLARTDIIFVGIVTIGLMGLTFDTLALGLARRLVPWVRQELDLGRV